MELTNIKLDLKSISPVAGAAKKVKPPPLAENNVANGNIEVNEKTVDSQSPRSVISKGTTFGKRFPKVEGLSSKVTKEYGLLAEMGMDSLIPSQYRSKFSRRDDDGN